MKKHSPRFLRVAEEAKRSVRECTVQQVHQRMEAGEDFALIDVREDREYKVDHIAGAQHLGRGILERDIETHFSDSDTELILYCGGGYRSALAAESLMKMGYTNVQSMDGGIQGWRHAKLPLVRD